MDNVYKPNTRCKVTLILINKDIEWRKEETINKEYKGKKI